MRASVFSVGLSFFLLVGCSDHQQPQPKNSVTSVEGRSGAESALDSLLPLQVSSDGHYFQTSDQQPFFWLGDTAWLLFQKLDRQQAERYLDDRKEKGFTVIQAMVVHELPEVNVYGQRAFIDGDPRHPMVLDDSTDTDRYDYWDHVDYIIDLAAKKGLYMALVPIWGSAAKSLAPDESWAQEYGYWLAQRYRDRPHVIWLNGGDVRGDQIPDVWQSLGNGLEQGAPDQLKTFHPFGGTQSSTWFHTAPWLDFNMFQSGHRRYDQKRDVTPESNWKGEDNWRYVTEDRALVPVKPTLDGEPPYEDIPQGLHDSSQPYWSAAEVRRYAYWSVFAGASGHTYGHNSVMQMYQPGDDEGAYGVKDFWFTALNAEAAGQMQFLRQLLLQFPYFERVPAPELLATGAGQKHDYIAATRGRDYALFYSWRGLNISVDTRQLPKALMTTHWFNPRTGETDQIREFDNTEWVDAPRVFDPPGEVADGNDWVLVMKTKTEE